MGIEEIQQDTRILRREKQEMEEKLRQIKTGMKGICREMQQMETMWDGPAHAAFSQQFNADCQRIESALKEMERLLTCMEQAAEAYGACEKAVEEAVSGISI